MVELRLKETDQLLGTISEDEMQFLQDNLEEESLTDDDYTIDPLTLAYLKENGLSANLAQLLTQALEGRDEVEIVYEHK